MVFLVLIKFVCLSGQLLGHIDIMIHHSVQYIISNFCFFFEKGKNTILFFNRNVDILLLSVMNTHQVFVTGKTRISQAQLAMLVLIRILELVSEHTVPTNGRWVYISRSDPTFYFDLIVVLFYFQSKAEEMIWNPLVTCSCIF